MDVMDELREALTIASGAREQDCWLVLHRDTIDEAFDAFAAAHPGLVDLTTCGPQCPAWNHEDVDWEPSCDVAGDAAPTGSPCLVMEGRK